MLPAATGIDVYSDDLIVLFMASKNQPQHYENPEQCVTSNYPEKYGPARPAFARATKAKVFGRDAYLISGTASIKGYEAVYLNNIVMQTKTMLHNVDLMLKQAGDLTGFQKEGVVYVKNEQDIPIVRDIVQAHHLDLRATYLIADVCREQWLTEMELTLIK